MRREFPNAATALFVALGVPLFAPGDAVAGPSVTPIRPMRLPLPAPREQVPDNRSEPARVATATNPAT